ncbi:AIG2-like protein D [Vitis vinifera]|uniref:Putative gamma-glutamylcyclotransferase n=1 Tax=Vitis vinifera TaxID=29760 RepID=A0A438C375_VITVI|nr:AIG2-like protein D [Vitis vinifera]
MWTESGDYIQEMAMASSAPQNLHAVFVYGSLLADEVVAVLLNRVPQSSAAVLHNLCNLVRSFILSLVHFELVLTCSHRFSIKGRVYPAILPVENKKVTGRVCGIIHFGIIVVRYIEDVEYDRRTVEVSLMDGPEKLQAKTYVWRNSNDTNLYGDWDLSQQHRGLGFISIFSSVLKRLFNLMYGFSTDFFSIFVSLIFKQWKGVHMENFVKMTMSFVEELELPESMPRVTTYETFFQQAVTTPPCLNIIVYFPVQKCF